MNASEDITFPADGEQALGNGFRLTHHDNVTRGVEWASAHIGKNSGSWSPEALRKMAERMEQTHADIRGILGGVMLRVPVRQGRTPTSNEAEDVGRNIVQAMGDPWANTDRDLFRSVVRDMRQTTIHGRHQPDGARTTKKVVQMVRSLFTLHDTELKDATVTEIQNTMANWLEVYTADTNFTVTFSTRFKAFMRLGHYRADGNSCWREHGCNEWDKFLLAQIPNSFVALVRDESGEARGRAWGFWDTSSFFVNNAYSRGMSSTASVRDCIIAGAEKLGLDTEEWSHHIRNFYLPLYQNDDERSFAVSCDIDLNANDFLCNVCGDEAVVYEERDGAWCDHHREVGGRYYCQNCDEHRDGTQYEVDGMNICEGCYEETHYCTHCEESTFSEDGAMINGDYVCEHCADRHTTTCKWCNEIVWNSDTHETALDGSVCESCWNNDGVFCVNCGDMLHHSQTYRSRHDAEERCESCHSDHTKEIEEHDTRTEEQRKAVQACWKIP